MHKGKKDMDFSRLENNIKSEMLEYVRANPPQPWLCEAGSVSPFFMQLVEDGYIERLNSAPGVVCLRPTQKLVEECSRWDAAEIERQLQEDRRNLDAAIENAQGASLVF